MEFSELLYLDASGFHYPDYPTTLSWYEDKYRAVFGADVYLGADSQDGQWIAIQALATFQTMQVMAWVYQYSPAYAQGDALSRNVKINGLQRLVPTASTALLTLTGTDGTVVTNGIAQDTNGVRWALPTPVTITSGTPGQVVVLGTCQVLGAVRALAGTINKIATPTRGWTSVTNGSEAVEGQPVETDAQLRIRQSESTMIPSLSVMEGIVGAVATVDGVGRHRGYENDTNTTDGDGIPGHTIAIVVESGVADEIAQAIAAKKTAGTGTWGPSGDVTGGTTVTVFDQYGVPTDINFVYATPVPISVEITYTDLPTFVVETESAIANAVVEYVNGLAIGDDVFLNRLFTPANLGNTGIGATFYIDEILISRDGDPVAASNVTIAFNEIPSCAFENITLVQAS